MRTFAVVNAVVTATNALLSAGMASMGWRLLGGLDGYLNRATVTYYLAFPLAMAVCALALYAAARFTRFRAPALVTQFLMFLVLFPYLLFYTGGI